METVNVPSFGLGDIPDDWEIELSQQFVDELDRMNRPWKWKNGKYDPAKRPGHKCVIWPAGEWSRKRDPDYNKRTPAFLRKHAFYARLWGYHRWHDPHVSRYGYNKPCDTGNWIRKSQIPVLREGVNISDIALEKVITGFRKGIFSNNVRVMKGRLPIRGSKWWAWLLGFYFRVGTVYHRERYYSTKGVNIKLRVHEDVVPLLREVITNVGGKFVLANAQKTHTKLPKDLGLGTTARRTVNLGWPEYIVLVKMGLPTDYTHEETRKSGSRAVKPKIPEWVKNNDEFMRSFVEGYVNGGVQSTIAHDGKGRPVPHLFIFIRNNGRSEQYVARFVSDIKDWFDRKGVTSYCRKVETYKIEGRVMYEVSFQSLKSHRFFLENFEIRLTSLRARLLICEEAERNQLVYEILRELNAPDDVILGMLFEKPQSQSDLEARLQMRKQGITRSLETLQGKGIIVKSGNTFFYAPAIFKERWLKREERVGAALVKQAGRVSASLLFQCEKCGSVDTRQTCFCGGSMKPISRASVLRTLNMKYHASERLIAKVCEVR